MVVRVAAVDDDVARGEQRGQRVHLGIDQRRRHHQPHRARRPQRVDEAGQRRRPGGAFGRQCGDRLRGDVEHDALVAGAQQPPHHVPAHASQPDHPQLHRTSRRRRARRGAGAFRRRRAPQSILRASAPSCAADSHRAAGGDARTTMAPSLTEEVRCVDRSQSPSRPRPRWPSPVHGPGSTGSGPPAGRVAALRGRPAAEAHAECQDLRRLPVRREPVLRRRARPVRRGQRRHGAGGGAQRRLHRAHQPRRHGPHAEVDRREPQRADAEPPAGQRHRPRDALRGRHRHRPLVRHEDRRTEGQRPGAGRDPLQRPRGGRRRHHLRHPDRHAAGRRPAGRSTRSPPRASRRRSSPAPR